MTGEVTTILSCSIAPFGADIAAGLKQLEENGVDMERAAIIVSDELHKVIEKMCFNILVHGFPTAYGMKRIERARQIEIIEAQSEIKIERNAQDRQMPKHYGPPRRKVW